MTKRIEESREEYLSRRRQWNRENRVRLRDRENAARRRRYATDPEYAASVRARAALWPANNRERVRVRRRLWRSKHQERLRALQAAWYQANKERVNAKRRSRRRRGYQAERLAALKQQAKWTQRYRDDPGFRAQARRKWRSAYHADPEASRAAARRRYHANKARALIAVAIDNLISKEIKR